MPPRDLTVIPVLDPIEDISRRQLLTAIPALGLLAAGISCGDDDETDPTPTDTSAPTTRPFTDATGTTVEIPVRPRRIVQVGQSRRGLGPLLSLGAPVVGASIWGEHHASVAEFFDTTGIVDVGATEPELDIEAIAALNPDLIVANYYLGEIEFFDSAISGQLMAIAPTVAIDSSVPIDDYIARIAEAAGVDVAHLAGRRAALAERVDEVRSVLGDPAEVTVSALRLRDDGDINVYGGPGTRPVNDILDRAGIAWSAIAREAEAAGGGIAGVSGERMRELECDLLVHYGLLPETYNPLFNQLAVVQAEQIVISEAQSQIGFTYESYIAAADDLLAQLRALPSFRTDIV